MKTLHLTSSNEPSDLHLRAIVGINRFIQLIEEMPFGQGVIVTMFLGVLMGTMAFQHVETVVTITKLMSLLTVFGLGSWTIYLLQYDRRKEKQMLTVGILMIMVANIMYFVDYQKDIFLILHNGATIVIMLFLFIVGVQGYIRAISRRR